MRISQLAAQIDQAEHRIAQLQAFTATLRQALHRLEALPDRPAPCDPDCPSGIRPSAPAPSKPNTSNPAASTACRRP
jgi:MerR family copper efflux transcriptional regulator